MWRAAVNEKESVLLQKTIDGTNPKQAVEIRRIFYMNQTNTSANVIQLREKLTWIIEEYTSSCCRHITK